MYLPLFHHPRPRVVSVLMRLFYNVIRSRLRHCFTLHSMKYILILFLLWIFVALQTQFVWWLRWAIFGFPAPPTDLINCPTLRRTNSLVVVIPLIASQLPRLTWNIRRWADEQYMPCDSPSSSLPALAFFFDRPLSEKHVSETVNNLRQLLNEPALDEVLHRCFSNVTYRSANLSAEETINSHWIDLVHNLVQTGGSNKQFEVAFSEFVAFNHMFYMEPDTYPIRSNWLHAVQEETSYGDFWQRGPIMRYPTKFNIALEPFRSRYQRHINGNSIYRIGDSCFSAYRKLVRDEYGNGAFDVAMVYYRLDSSRLAVWQAVAHRFQVSTLVVGLSVHHFDNLPDLFPTTYLVHGKADFVKKTMFGILQY